LDVLHEQVPTRQDRADLAAGEVIRVSSVRANERSQVSRLTRVIFSEAGRARGIWKPRVWSSLSSRLSSVLPAGPTRAAAALR
jgi:hypothetical protein